MGNDLNSIGTLIQARVNSIVCLIRFFYFAGRFDVPGRVLDQHRSMRFAGTIVVVTSDTAADDAIESSCRSEGFQVLEKRRGCIGSVFLRCPVHYKLQIIIRGTGDNPLVDPYLGDALAQDFIDKKADYATNKSVDVDSGLPDGVGLEVFSFNALEVAHYCGLKDHHREHINEYILENPERFRISVFKPYFFWNCWARHTSYCR